MYTHTSAVRSRFYSPVGPAPLRARPRPHLGLTRRARRFRENSQFFTLEGECEFTAFILGTAFCIIHCIHTATGTVLHTCYIVMHPSTRAPARGAAPPTLSRSQTLRSSSSVSSESESLSHFSTLVL